MLNLYKEINSLNKFKKNTWKKPSKYKCLRLNLQNKFFCTYCNNVFDKSNTYHKHVIGAAPCKACVKCKRIKNYEKNKEIIKVKHKIYRLTEKGKEVHRKESKKYRLKNKKLCIERSIKSMKTRIKNDPFYRFIQRVRSRAKKTLKVRSWRKNNTFAQYIGCNRETLRSYMESKFTPGMTWDNYGEWHIDHIIPLCSAKTEQEIYILCHYTNLQPLWAEDNMKKGGKLLPP